MQTACNLANDLVAWAKRVCKKFLKIAWRNKRHDDVETYYHSRVEGTLRVKLFKTNLLAITQPQDLREIRFLKVREISTSKSNVLWTFVVTLSEQYLNTVSIISFECFLVHFPNFLYVCVASVGLDRPWICTKEFMPQLLMGGETSVTAVHAYAEVIVPITTSAREDALSRCRLVVFLPSCTLFPLRQACVSLNRSNYRCKSSLHRE